MARKSFTTRIKITKTGKVRRRAMAQDHFRAKKSSRQLKRIKLPRSLALKKKTIVKYL